MSELIYVASPYSHRDPLVMDDRANRVIAFTAKALIAGFHVFSPIAHYHEMAKLYDLPRDHEFWLAYDKTYLDLCKQMWVVKIPGYEKSEGVNWEKGYIEGINKEWTEYDEHHFDV